MKRILLGVTAAWAAPLLPTFPAAAEASLDRQLSAACRAVREVDRARLPAPGDTSGLTYHADMRAGAATPPAGHSGPLILLFGRQSVPGPTPSLSVIAWKQGDGRWFVSRLRHDPPGAMPTMPLMWPHEAGVDTAGLPPSYWYLSEGVLGAAETAELERILASRCLAREPPVRPANLPLRRGRELVCMWHPTSYHVEIGGAGTASRSYTRSCRHYRSGDRTEDLQWASDLLSDLIGRAPVGAPRAAARREAAAIPERFRGRWAQGADRCGDATLMRLEVGADSIDLSAGPNRVRSVDVRGERTIVVNATGSAFFPGLPAHDFEMPLLLSPDGERMAVPQPGSGLTLQLSRCPGA